MLLVSTFYMPKAWPKANFNRCKKIEVCLHTPLLLLWTTNIRSEGNFISSLKQYPKIVSSYLHCRNRAQHIITDVRCPQGPGRPEIPSQDRFTPVCFGSCRSCEDQYRIVALSVSIRAHLILFEQSVRIYLLCRRTKTPRSKPIIPVQFSRTSTSKNYILVGGVTNAQTGGNRYSARLLLNNFFFVVSTETPETRTVTRYSKRDTCVLEFWTRELCIGRLTSVFLGGY